MNEIAVVEWTDEDVSRILDLTQATLGTGGAVAKTEAFWRGSIRIIHLVGHMAYSR